MDRRHALAMGAELPDRTTGAALFADISGFTPLTDVLFQALGPQRGAEELTRYLNTVYDTITAKLDSRGGSVINFSGDAITAWFDGDDGEQAIACGLDMLSAMDEFAHMETPGGG